MIWRIVVAKLGTLKEVQIEWSMKDLADAHEALDVQEEYEEYKEYEIEQQRLKSGNR